MEPAKPPTALSAPLVALPEARYVGASTSRHDLIIEAFCADHEHLLQFVSNSEGPLPTAKVTARACERNLCVGADPIAGYSWRSFSWPS